MRSWIAAAIILTAASAAAHAQQYDARDACSPLRRTGNALIDLAATLAQAQRDAACASERRAQWAEYNNRQQAAHEAEQARAAQIASQQAVLQAQLQQRAEQVRQARATTEAKSRARREQARLADQKAERLAADQRRLRAIQLIHDENAPQNVCHQPKLAKAVMAGWNDLDTMKEAGVAVIDIEHVTTAALNPADGAFSCHGIFVTNRGWKVIGTATVRKNIAGDAMFIWKRDSDQDFAAYDAQEAPTASSAEMGQQTRVGEPPATVTRVMATSAAPPI